MTDEQTTSAGQVPEMSSPQAGAAATGQEAQPEERASVQADQAFKAELEEARKQAAKYRTELRQVQERLSKYEQEKLTEQEKLAKRAEEAERTAQELQARLREIAIRSEVQSVAQKLGVHDAEAAYKLLDVSKLSVGDDGNIEGVEEAVKALVKAKPYLLASRSSASVNPQRSDGAEEPNPIVERIKQAGQSPFDLSWLKRQRG